VRINHVLAQEIANKVMKVIPHNVNIMDHAGVIIGTGDHERLNTYHHGAIDAIKQRKMVPIYHPTSGAKPGVNIPITFKNKIIGVIGISGDPTIVSPFAELVLITTELLINQEFLFKEKRVKEQLLEEFLYQWAFRADSYDTAFINSGEAVGINLTLSRKAIIVSGKMNRELQLLKEHEYFVRFRPETILYIVPEQSDILGRLEPLLTTNDTKIGIGNCNCQIAKSVQEAERAIEITDKLGLNERYCVYKNLQFIDYLSNKDLGQDELYKVYMKLEKSSKGPELTETLISFIKNSGDMNAISKEMHIHRNSLAYRLQKIELVTNKNPKNFTELFELYTGYVLSKINS
jgi:carbohydrate diacid regulator